MLSTYQNGKSFPVYIVGVIIHWEQPITVTSPPAASPMSANSPKWDTKSPSPPPFCPTPEPIYTPPPQLSSPVKVERPTPTRPDQSLNQDRDQRDHEDESDSSGSDGLDDPELPPLEQMFRHRTQEVGRRGPGEDERSEPEDYERSKPEEATRGKADQVCAPVHQEQGHPVDPQPVTSRGGNQESIRRPQKRPRSFTSGATGLAAQGGEKRTRYGRVYGKKRK